MKKEIIKGFKGFDKNLRCNGGDTPYQYEIDKTYKEDVEPRCCSKGFHFCEYPLDVFNFYGPCNDNAELNRFCEVEALGAIDREDDCTKIATNKIKIGAEIDFQALAKASIKFIYEHAKKTKCKGANLKSNNSVASNTGYRSVASNTGDSSVASNTGNCSVASNTGYRSVASNTGNCSVASNTGNCSVASNTGYRSVASNTGNCSVASNTGYRSVASNTGDSSVASNTGYRSVASNTGNCSVASNTGYRSVASNTGDSSVASNTGDSSVASNTGNCSVASNTGENGIASSLGIQSKAKGLKGTWLVLAEWIEDDDWNWKVKEVKTVKIDGKKIKENTLYQLIDGKFVEVQDADI